MSAFKPIQTFFFQTFQNALLLAIGTHDIRNCQNKKSFHSEVRKKQIVLSI